MSKYKDIMTDANVLFDAYKVSRKASPWKKETMKCDLNYLSVISKKKHELENQTYEPEKTKEFVVNERGRLRAITSTTIEGRIVRHALCDNILSNELVSKLIYNNGASIKGRGVDFQRERFEKDLHDFYRKHKTNDGYILFIDFSKYYDNIRHNELLNDVFEVIEDEYINWLLTKIVESFKIDVSQLSDEQIEYYMNNVFNSIEYRNHDYKKTGEKKLDKSLNIGDQASQIFGSFYPYKIDNYIKIVKSIKQNGRYVDDTYIMAKTKQELVDLLKELKPLYDKYGIIINWKKTRIVKMSSTYTFLKVKYSLTKTGKVVKRIENLKITRMRRKLKKWRVKLDSKEMTYKDIENKYKSFIGGHKKIMSKRQ